MMELVVKAKKSTITLRNLFNSMNDLCIARTQWNNRMNISSYLDQYIRQCPYHYNYYGIVFTKNGLSVAEVDNSGSLLLWITDS